MARPDSYGVSVVAIDADCRAVASLCVATPTDRSTPLVLRPARAAPAGRDCGIARCRAGCSADDAGAAGLDGGARDAAPRDAGGADTSAPDASVDAPMSDAPVGGECVNDLGCRRTADCLEGQCVGGVCTNFVTIPDCTPT